MNTHQRPVQHARQPGFGLGFLIACPLLVLALCSRPYGDSSVELNQCVPSQECQPEQLRQSLLEHEGRLRVLRSQHQL